MGVNCFKDEAGEKSPIELLRIPAELEASAVERVRAYRAKRSQGALTDAMRALQDGAKGDANLQGLILSAVKAGATLGEISDSLRAVFGQFKEYAGF